MTIQVTQAHIDQASATSSYCAVCHALVDAFPAWKDKPFYMNGLPQKAKQFRQRMLAGEPVKPFSFEYSESDLELWEG